MVLTDTLSRSADPQALIRVIFADDSAAIRTLARYALSAQRGFTIVGEAADGAEALRLVEEHDAQCVILDIEMPGMGGFEALEQLQQRRPGIPVVMLSGHSDPETNDRSVEAGAAAYLEKGTGLSALAETVRRVTGSATRANPARVLEQQQREPEPAAEPSPTDTSAADLRRLEYVVSHDLAEPARIMTGFSNLLASRYATSLDESGQLFLEHIQSAAARMQAMIDDLLTFSRAGRSEPTLSPVNTGEVVHEVFRALEPAATRTGAQLTTGQLPTVWADRGMVKTVLHHLVLNGLLFNTSPVPTVEVAGTTDEEQVVVTVTDNGIGISPQHQSEVFELFRRLNTREEYAGTGTGLALCHRLITLQHGTISLSSTLGTGTTVTITLPLPTPGESR